MLAVAYLYLWLFIDTNLLYHGFGRFVTYHPFQLNLGFFANTFSRIGGPAEYAAGFLSQLFYFPVLGALVITVLAVCFWLITRTLLADVGVDSGRLVLVLVPPVLILLSYNAYGHCLRLYLALLVALAVTLAYIRLPLRPYPARLAVFALFFAVTYWAAAGSALVFAVLSAACEVRRRNRTTACAAIPAIAVGLVAVLGLYYHTLTPKQAFLEMFLVFGSGATEAMERLPRFLAGSLVFFYPAMFLLVGLWPTLFKAPQPTAGRKPAFARKHRSPARTCLALAVLAIVIVLTFYLTYNSSARIVLRFNHFSLHHRYHALLEFADRLPQERLHSVYRIHDIDVALYQTGRMPDKMFGYPQKPEALLLSFNTEGVAPFIYQRRGDLLMEMGHTAIAQRLYHEVLESIGPCPFVLERLALASLAKGQTETAAVYLKVLADDLVYRKEARKILAALDTGSAGPWQDRVEKLRSVVVKQDYTGFETTPEVFFETLLQTNRHNRMAFEYMMALYLLTGSLDSFVENIARLAELGYERLPEHYAQAIVIYLGSGHKKTDLNGWMPAEQVFYKAKRFDTLYQRLGGFRNPQGARDLLRDEFGDTYWFYYMFELPRLKTREKKL